MTTVSATYQAFSGEYIVRSPFGAKDAIKRLPAYARRWDADGKVWKIDAAHIEHLRKELSRDGYTLVVTNPPPKPNRAQPKPAPRSPLAWVEDAFRACPQGNRNKLRAGLLRAMHPDVGGDTVTAQKINEIADYYNRRQP